MMFTRRTIWLITLCLLNLACSRPETLEEKLDDYQTRLANILVISPPVNTTPTLLDYPNKSVLTNSKRATQIKLFEFYTLKHCRLYALVADRNTSLGRVQLPSIRYQYEQDLIQALEECIADTSDDSLLVKLNQWKTAKVANLPLVWADVIQQSTEIKQALSARGASIFGDARDGLGPTLQALKGLAVDTEPSIKSNIENHLQTLQKYALPAKMRMSQTTLVEQLSATNQWLNEHQAQFYCSRGQATQQKKYLANVFQRYFIEIIQPLASKLNHYHYQFRPIFELWLTSPHLSEAFKQFIEREYLRGFNAYKDAMAKHIQLWQGFYKQCDLAPGSVTV
jgi:ABC-type transporter Mla subunit MlaD